MRLAIGKQTVIDIPYLTKVLKEKWDFNVVVFTHSSHYEIRWTKRECVKLMNLIGNYIIPSMAYKFPSSETLCGTYSNGVKKSMKTKSELCSDIQNTAEMTVSH